MTFVSTGKVLNLGTLELNYGSVLYGETLMLESNNIILHPGSTLSLVGRGQAAMMGSGQGTTVSNPGSTISNPRSTVSNPGSTLSNTRSTVSNPGSTVSNPGSTVSNPGSTVSNP